MGLILDDRFTCGGSVCAKFRRRKVNCSKHFQESFSAHTELVQVTPSSEKRSIAAIKICVADC